MLEVSKEDINFLKEHIDNVDELIQNDSRKPLLRAVYDIIMYKGFDEEYEYNSFGEKAQDVYDRILDDNYDKP